jgi:hypothetical protein
MKTVHKILLANIGLSLSLSLLAGLIAINLSRDYHAGATYHYDSAAYRLHAIETHDTLLSGGKVSAVAKALREKDGLDIVIRLLLAPNALLQPYGHMVVLIPFMAIFVFLLSWYVFDRSGSFWLSIAVIPCVYMFPFLYNPFMGMADYWKDNLAMWLLGSAAVSWMLSDHWMRWSWGTISSVFLGLLVMQRTVASVYACMLFAPLFLWTLWVRFRLDTPRQVFLQVAAVGAPALIIAASVAMFQADSLYRYYFVAGYDYGTHAGAAEYFQRQVLTKLGRATGVMGAISIACVVVGFRKCQLSDVVCAGWLVIGFPVVTVATSARYNGIAPLWAALLVVFLGTLIPRELSRIRAAGLASVLMAVAFCVTIHHVSILVRHPPRTVTTEKRLNLFEDLVAIVTSEPTHRYAFLFDEIEGPFLNQAFFGSETRLPRPVIFQSIHDTYYTAQLGDVPPDTIAKRQIESLEQIGGTIVVTYSDPSTILTKSGYLDNGREIAGRVTKRISDHVQASTDWDVVAELDSEYGNLSVYQYAVETPGVPDGASSSVLQ